MGSRRGFGTVSAVLVLGVLLAASLWLRLSALGALPEVNGDEAFYGLAAHRLAHGGHLPPATVNGNIPNPVAILLITPLVTAFGPSSWVLRLPGMISGLLAVVLTYSIGRRVLDRPAATVAAGVLAFLPPCVMHAEIGCESAQTPLFGVLALLAAFSARPVLVVVAFLAAFFVYPWNVFLLPVLACVFVASAVSRLEGRTAKLRVALASAVVVGLLAGAVGLYAKARDVDRIGVLAGDRSLDWSRFLGAFGATVSGATMQEEIGTAGPADVALRTWAFWALATTALALGVPRLVSERRWDRLGLVVGLAAGVASLHLVAGGAVLGPGTTRYGYEFLAPLSFALGVLVGPSLVRRTADGQVRPRFAVAFSLLAAGGLLLGDLGAHVLQTRAAQGGGTLLAPWRARGMVERTYDAIVADLDRTAAAGEVRAVVARSYWIGNPLKYLAMDRDNLRVVAYEALGPDESTRQRALTRLLSKGGYLVGFVDQPVADEARSVTSGAAIRLWAVRHAGVHFVTLTRLARPEDAAVAAREPASDDRRVR